MVYVEYIDPTLRYGKQSINLSSLKKKEWASQSAVWTGANIQ